jgi:hypothetical protein
MTRPWAWPRKPLASRFGGSDLGPAAPQGQAPPPSYEPGRRAFESCTRSLRSRSKVKRQGSAPPEPDTVKRRPAGNDWTYTSFVLTPSSARQFAAEARLDPPRIARSARRPGRAFECGRYKEILGLLAVNGMAIMRPSSGCKRLTEPRQAPQGHTDRRLAQLEAGCRSEPHDVAGPRTPVTALALRR